MSESALVSSISKTHTITNVLSNASLGRLTWPLKLVSLLDKVNVMSPWPFLAKNIKNEKYNLVTLMNIETFLMEMFSDVYRNGWTGDWWCAKTNSSLPNYNILKPTRIRIWSRALRSRSKTTSTRCLLLLESWSLLSLSLTKA